MSVDDPSIETLLARARRGDATSAELDRVEQCLAASPSEKALYEMSLSFEEELAPQPGDAAIARRIAQRVVQRGNSETRPSPRRATTGRRRAVLAFAGVAACAGLAVAAHRLFAEDDSSQTEVQVPEADPPPQAGDRRPPDTNSTHTEPQTAGTATAGTPGGAPAPEAERRAEVPQPLGPDSSPMSAGELLEKANQERTRGNIANAVATYRRLQTAYPASPEAGLSRVSLGQLLLATDPSGALAEFSAYPGGSLAAEAAYGRARSLRALGRTSEELRAWRLLLEKYPHSVYAERARNRLASGTPPHDR